MVNGIDMAIGSGDPRRADTYEDPTPRASRVDSELLQLWRSGVGWAGQQLLARHRPALLRFFRNRARDDAHELLQRSFLACLEKRDTLRSATSFRAFLFGVARLELLRHIDERRRMPDAIDPAGITLSDPQTVPSHIVVRRQERRRLAQALAELPGELQIVVALQYWERLTTAQIAEVEGIPVGTVKSRLRRAKQRLLAQLGAPPSAANRWPWRAPTLETWAQTFEASGRARAVASPS